jgi:hypothetical protein
MTNDTVDLLQIKIEQAKRKLPLETVNAIDAVDWRAAIMGLRNTKGYTFEQLGDLEIETELVLCGLVNPKDYQRELETRMKISRSAASEVVETMNDLVFKRIKEELIKNSERKKIFASKEVIKNSPLEEYPSGGGGVNSSTPSQVRATPEEGNKPPNPEVKNPIPVPEKLEITGKVLPILAQKLITPVQMSKVETDYTLNNISKVKVDPYREIPE